MVGKIAKHLSMGLSAVSLMEAAGMTPDPWQADLLQSRADRTLLLCGRQTGKSTISSLLGLHLALYSPGSLVLLLSPSLRQSQELFRRVSEFYNSLKRPIPATAETTQKLELGNGSRIVSLPAQERTVRGYSAASLLIVDEAARVLDELYHTVRPMLATGGGRLILLSTPWGKRGFFYEEWGGIGDWLRIEVPATSCKRIKESFLEEERRSLPEAWFRQEYLCEFVERSGQLFSYDLIMSSLTDEKEPFFPVLKTEV